MLVPSLVLLEMNLTGDSIPSWLVILPLQALSSDITLQTMRKLNHELSPTGQGNAVSIEFNLLYRWHATLSRPDSDWVAGFFSRAFPGQDLSTV